MHIAWDIFKQNYTARNTSFATSVAITTTMEEDKDESERNKLIASIMSSGCWLSLNEFLIMFFYKFLENYLEII